jgi:hypothetical protein
VPKQKPARGKKGIEDIRCKRSFSKSSPFRPWVQDTIPSGARERGNLLLANYISIGLSFGFFTVMIKNFALPSNLTEMGGGETGKIS